MTRGAAFFMGEFGCANMLEGELAFTPEIGTNWHTPPLLGFPDGGFLCPAGEIVNQN